MKNKIVSLRGVNVVYTNPEGSEFYALKDINLDIYQGDYLAILGASGSGKTTLSNIIGMLNGNYAGSYVFDGQECQNKKESERVRIRGEKFGFIFQDYILLDHLTALDNVALALQFSPFTKKKIYELAKAKLFSVGLGEKLNHRPYQLSGGQKQRVAIARALIKNPKLIIADEPTGALDSASRVEVLSLLQELNQLGVTIITVTHSAEDAQAARRIIKVEGGKITSDLLQRHRTRYFGKLLDVKDSDQLNNRKKIVMDYVSLTYGIKSKEEFLKFFETCDDAEILFKLLVQLRPQWLTDENIQKCIADKFSDLDELLQLIVVTNIMKARREQMVIPLLQEYPKRFFQFSLNEETCMYFFKSVHDFNALELRDVLVLDHFFSHDSEKVRATSIDFFKVDGLIDANDFDYFLDMVLTDSDYRVRSNMLDYLYKQKRINFEQLAKYHFAADPAPRVKAIWAEILNYLGMRDQAMEILEPLLFSKDIPSLSAAVWVLSKDHDFNLESFLRDRVDKNPHLLSHIDDIIFTFDRVKKHLSKWRHEGEIAS